MATCRLRQARGSLRAVREVREELGLDRPLGRPLVIDYASADDRMPEGIAFVFDGGLISDEEVRNLELTDPEIVRAGLYELDEALPNLEVPLTRRLTVAVDAARRGGLALCNDGVAMTH